MSATSTTKPSGSNGETSADVNGSTTTAPTRRRDKTTWEKAFRLLIEERVKVTFVSDNRYLIRATVMPGKRPTRIL